MADIFSQSLRAARRNRARASGPELFIANRLADDLEERLRLINRDFDDALLIGSPSEDITARFAAMTGTLAMLDPAALAEDAFPFEPATFDLVIAFATFDTANALADILLKIRFALKPDGLLLGTAAGGDTMPTLRTIASQAAAKRGMAVPRIHPRLKPSAMAGALQDAGFVMPVVDVERIDLRYPTLDRLIADLRGMAATNVMPEGAYQPLNRIEYRSLHAAFDALRDGEGKTAERFEFLNFNGWSPAQLTDG